MWHSFLRMFLFAILTGMWFFVFLLAYESHTKVTDLELQQQLQGAYLIGIAQCRRQADPKT